MRSYFFNHSGVISLLKVLAVLMVILVLLYYRPWLNERGQAEWAHGINLPKSALNIQTVGDWRREFLDRGATTVFTVDASNIEKFISKFQEVKLVIGAGPPGNGVYHRGIDKPWHPDQEPMKASSYASPVGDWISVEVYKLTDEISAVRLYTDWN